MVKKYFLMVSMCIVLSACTSYTSHIKTKQSQRDLIVFDNSDIQLFYTVIDAAKSEEKEITGQYMYEEYVQKSSAGLKNGYAVARDDIFPVDEDGAIDYAIYDKKIKALLSFYEKNRNSILNRTLLSKKQKQNIEQKLCDFLETNLCAQLLDNTGIYVSISGGFNMAGTAFIQGVFIDASMLYNESIDYSLLPEKARRFSDVFYRKEDILFLIAHEFMHVFQIKLTKHNRTIDNGLLRISLIEGGADYFARKAIGKEVTFYRSSLREDYMKNNKEEYMKFLEDIQKSRASQDDEEKEAILLKWFFNGASKEVAQGLYPEDLGYYIGSKIFETFYEDRIKTQNRDEVIKQLLLLEISEKDIETILERLATSI